MDSIQTLPRKTPLPLFALLESPYGMNSAVVATLPMYVLHAEGISLEKGAAISALCLMPSTFYFLYSPVVDFFMRRRSWYLLTLFFLTVFTGSTILIPAITHLQLMTATLFASTFVAMLIGAATGGMANQLGSARKKNVGAWMQMGNLGSSSLMMALLIYASLRYSQRALAALAMSTILLPGLAVLAVDEPTHREPFGTFAGSMRETWIELKTVFLSRRAVPALLLLLSPIGNSGLSSVLLGLTKTYHATDAQLAFADGWGAGIITALGALCTLLTPKSWNRMLPYAMVGVAYGASSLAIGLLPLTPTGFIMGLLLTNFAAGVAYGLYTGLVLQTAGFGGLRHSTRYTILNSLGSIAVVYMLALLGFVSGRRGAHAAAMTDGAMNIGAAVLFFAWWAWVRMRHPSLLKVVKIPDEVMLTN